MLGNCLNEVWLLLHHFTMVPVKMVNVDKNILALVLNRKTDLRALISTQTNCHPVFHFTDCDVSKQTYINYPHGKLWVFHK